MNTKEFLMELSNRTGLSSEETASCMALLVEGMADQLCNSNVISIQGFGTFEVKKKNERIIVNPASHKKMLVPPKLSLDFKPSVNLKERFK